jgi:hypothetical protein
MIEKKQPERFVAIAKQPRNETSLHGCFVTATKNSGMWRNVMLRNLRRGC